MKSGIPLLLLLAQALNVAAVGSTTFAGTPREACSEKELKASLVKAALDMQTQFFEPIGEQSRQISRWLLDADKMNLNARDPGSVLAELNYTAPGKRRWNDSPTRFADVFLPFWAFNQSYNYSCAIDLLQRPGINEFDPAVLDASLAGCTYDSDDRLSVRCKEFNCSIQCPSYCAIFELQSMAGQSNNQTNPDSYVQFHYNIAQTLDYLLPSFMQDNDLIGRVTYCNDVGMCWIFWSYRFPPANVFDVTTGFPDGMYWISCVRAHPRMNPKQNTVFSAAYIDYGLLVPVFTAFTPVYDRQTNEFRGTVAADILLKRPSRLIEQLHPTERTFVMLVSADHRGTILVAQQMAWDRLFCPRHPLCYNSTTFHTDEQFGIQGDSVTGLLDSTNGYAELVGQIRQASEGLIVVDQEIWSWLHLDNIHSADYVMIFVTDINDIVDAYRWSLSSTSLVVRRSVPLARLRLNNYGRHGLAWTTQLNVDGGNVECLTISPSRSGVLQPNQTIELTVHLLTMDCSRGTLAFLPWSRSNQSTDYESCFSAITAAIVVEHDHVEGDVLRTTVEIGYLVAAIVVVVAGGWLCNSLLDYELPSSLPVRKPVFRHQWRLASATLMAFSGVWTTSFIGFAAVTIPDTQAPRVGLAIFFASIIVSWLCAMVVVYLLRHSMDLALPHKDNYLIQPVHTVALSNKPTNQALFVVMLHAGMNAMALQLFVWLTNWMVNMAIDGPMEFESNVWATQLSLWSGWLISTGVHYYLLHRKFRTAMSLVWYVPMMTFGFTDRIHSTVVFRHSNQHEDASAVPVEWIVPIVLAIAISLWGIFMMLNRYMTIFSLYDMEARCSAMALERDEWARKYEETTARLHSAKEVLQWINYLRPSIRVTAPARLLAVIKSTPRVAVDNNQQLDLIDNKSMAQAGELSLLQKQVTTRHVTDAKDSNQTIRKWLANPFVLEIIKDVAVSQHCAENIMFVMDADEFASAFADQSSSMESKITHARHLYELYIKPGALHEINVDSKTRTAVKNQLAYPKRSMFEAAANECLKLLRGGPIGACKSSVWWPICEEALVRFA